MGSFNVDWAAWAATQKSAADWTDDALANSAEETSDAISLDGKLACEVSVKCVYHASSTAGVTVYVYRDVDGTVYETAADGPWAFTMPFAAGGTKVKPFTMDASQAGSFKVSVANAGGQSVTISVKQRFATGLTAA